MKRRKKSELSPRYNANRFNVVDSSAWLEFVDDGPNADIFEDVILMVDNLIVPSIVILEVFKRMSRFAGEEAGLDLIGQMQQGKVISLDADLALEAARLGLLHRLPLADSVILATAYRYDAIVWTQDEDFEGIDNVNFVRKNG